MKEYKEYKENKDYKEFKEYKEYKENKVNKNSLQVSGSYIDIIGDKNQNLNNNKVIFYENGDEYKGVLVNGKKEGYGAYKTLYGYYYEGFFKNDEKDGQGRLTDNSNLVYIG